MHHQFSVSKVTRSQFQGRVVILLLAPRTSMHVFESNCKWKNLILSACTSRWKAARKQVQPVIILGEIELSTHPRKKRALLSQGHMHFECHKKLIG